MNTNKTYNGHPSKKHWLAVMWVNGNYGFEAYERLAKCTKKAEAAKAEWLFYTSNSEDAEIASIRPSHLLYALRRM